MDDAKRALECAIVSPSIRTVLLRGGEGTAKTVLARAAAGLTGKKLVNCPLNVTEEQLFGGLDVEETVRTGGTGHGEGPPHPARTGTSSTSMTST
jgi:magnesium chelatase subunit D